MAARVELPVHGKATEPARLRRALVVPAVVYPLWHLAAPAHAMDPWIAWWAVAASFLGVAVAAGHSEYVRQHLLGCSHVCSALVTLQLYLLAFANDMHPFYAVGSAMAVLTTVAFIRSRANLLRYAAFVALLGGVLFALAPDARKLAYWGGMLTVVAAWYHRISLQETGRKTEQAYQDALERRVAERTGELAHANHLLRREMEERERLEDELRFSQKMEALGRLAGGVAHDFNNLLTTIQLYADLLAEGLPAESPLQDEVRRIEKAGRQAAELTQQLLAFSRRGEVQTEVLDLGAVVAESASMLRHLLGEDVELVCKLGNDEDDEKEPACIRANASELQQVLVNLALNARDAMPSGGRFTLEVCTVRRGELPARGLPDAFGQDGYVRLCASDTGVGMDAETRARAFDPFFTRKEVRKGTGLGLSIVYGIVTGGGGHVRLLSEPGEGARFELLWPRSREAPAARGARNAYRRAPKGRESILLVEDEPDLRHALGQMLRGSGYRVTEAEDGEAALGLASLPDMELDLVLTDLVMPRMSGLELVDRLAALRPDLRVLLVSGHLNHPSLRDQRLREGMALLRKPFEAAELNAKLREVLESSGRGAG
jgi:signal transduction histidine kinase